jgi:hypothetical protein
MIQDVNAVSVMYHGRKVGTLSEGIGNLVESLERRICPMIYELAYLLFKDT